MRLRWIPLALLLVACGSQPTLTSSPTHSPEPPSTLTAPRGSYAAPDEQRIEQAEVQASRAAERSKEAQPEPSSKPQPEPDANAGEQPVTPDANPIGLPEGLLYIRDHESGGDYTAYNPTGCSDENGTFSCGGAFQLSEQYAAGWAAEAGFTGMSSQAQTWPRNIQDRVAVYKYYASNPDGTLWCNYTDYC